jgi:predicted RNA methylase
MDLDRPIRADLLLSTLPGAAPFLRDDLRPLPGVTLTGGTDDHVEIALDGPLRPLHDLQSYSSLALVVGPADGGANGIVEALASRAEDLASLLARVGNRAEGRVADRAAGRTAIGFRVGAELPDRGELIERIGAGLGWQNRPSDWDLNLTTRPAAQAGQSVVVVAELGGMFLTARLGELARMPASTTPVIADVMTRLAKLRPGQTVLDPFCGAGTLLVTAARRAALSAGGPARLRLLGCDLDPAALAAAQDNAARRAVPALVVRADAGALPVGDHRVDRIVSNLPFGKRVGSHRGNIALYPAFLRGAERVLAADGRMVLLTEDKVLLRETVQRTHGLKIIREVLLRSGGGTPTAYVVERSRRPRR